MSLRLQVNLILASVITAFVCVLLAFGVLATRASVAAETLAAHKVATYLMEKMATLYQRTNLPAVESELQRLGHVRSAKINLYGPAGALLYRSPPPTYKAGRFAPAWYSHLVSPQPLTSRIAFGDATLVIRSDASRAVLDGWDASVSLLKVGVVALVLGNLLVFWLVGRAASPFRTIVRGLRRMESGDYQTRLPELRQVAEAHQIADAFNRAAKSIEDNLAARREATEATVRAEYHRDLAAAVMERLEDERRRLARELHDETSQSLTAIRSMALALARNDGTHPDSVRDAAELIAATSGELYDAVHALIPRLNAPQLDELGLADALGDQLARWRREHPAVRIDASIRLAEEPLGASYALAAYRIVQEAVTNACRHGGAGRIDIDVRQDAATLHVGVCDDGRGLAPDWQRPGHFGLRGMRERAEALGGTFEVANRPEGGVRVRATLPFA